MRWKWYGVEGRSYDAMKGLPMNGLCQLRKGTGKCVLFLYSSRNQHSVFSFSSVPSFVRKCCLNGDSQLQHFTGTLLNKFLPSYGSFTLGSYSAKTKVYENNLFPKGYHGLHIRGSGLTPLHSPTAMRRMKSTLEMILQSDLAASKLGFCLL